MPEALPASSPATMEEVAMADADTLKRKIKVCMFDQYGTVVDMQTGLWEVAVLDLRVETRPAQPGLSHDLA